MGNGSGELGAGTGAGAGGTYTGEDEAYGPEAARGVWVYVEIQDHERVLDGSLELLSKGRALARQLGEPLVAVVMCWQVEQFLPEIARYGPDVIYYGSHVDFKHYSAELFVPLLLALVRAHRPAVLLVAATEFGMDLAPRLGWELHTGVTAHVTGLHLVDDAEHGANLLVMDKPAFGGDLMASVICPRHRPLIATVKGGVFEKRPLQAEETPLEASEASPGTGEISPPGDQDARPPAPRQVPIPYQKWLRIPVREPDAPADLAEERVRLLSFPIRVDPPTANLEDATFIVAGGQGVGSAENWALLERLAGMVNGKVGASRNAIWKGWAREEQLIGQTGVTVAPDVYIACGISGQIQHTAGILGSKVIVAINSDPDALIFNIADYGLVARVEDVLPALVAQLEDFI